MGKKQKILPTCEFCEAHLCFVLNELSKDEIQEVTLTKGGNVYKKGQIIFYEGTRPTGLYAISKGMVKVYKIDSTGKEHIVRLAREGDILGYRALITNDVYSAFASPLVESTICFIPKETFLQLMKSNSRLSMRIVQLLAQDLKNAEERLAKIAQKSVRERLAETLLILREFYGTESDQATLRAQLSRSDLAHYVGTATETVIRLLAEFKEEQLVDVQGRRIRLLKPHMLARIANLYD